jgi:DNA polymerase III subunit alpha
VLLSGAYSRRDQGADNPTFIVESVKPLAEVRVNGQVAVAIELTRGAVLPTGVLDDVRAVAEAHPGTAPLEVRWSDGNGTAARLKSRSLKLAATNAALTELRALLGQERVRLVRGS